MHKKRKKKRNGLTIKVGKIRTKVTVICKCRGNCQGFCNGIGNIDIGNRSPQQPNNMNGNGGSRGSSGRSSRRKKKQKKCPCGRW